MKEKRQSQKGKFAKTEKQKIKKKRKENKIMHARQHHNASLILVGC